MGVGVVPRSFFFFFLGFVNQGQGCCESSGTLQAGITTLAAMPTDLCGSLHSLEFSLQVRPKETHYRHQQHVGCSAGGTMDTYQGTLARHLFRCAGDSGHSPGLWQRAHRCLSTS